MKFHFYEIIIDRKYIYRVLNAANKINIRNIINKDDKTSFYVDYTDIDETLNILKGNNIHILKISEKGIYTKLTDKFIFKVAIIFAFVFISGLILCSRYIWEISVEGNYSYTTNKLKTFIYSQNIREGLAKNKINCEELEKKIRRKYNDISWVCAEIKGTNLIIHIKENYITEISKKETKPYHIAANKDAEIVSILVRSGVPGVKVGDKVKKGTILINGLVDVFDESEQKLFTKPCNSDGEVIGKTKYHYKDELKIDYKKKEYKKGYSYYLPSISGYKWVKTGNTKNKNIAYKEVKLKGFGNYYLPICIQKYTVMPYTSLKCKYTEKEAAKILKKRLYNKLLIMEQKGYKILEKNVKIVKQKDSYTCSGEIICLEPLGQVSYILEEDIQKINSEKESLNDETKEQ